MAGFVLAMLMCCCPQGGKAQTTEVFGLKQGVNIGDWLSQKANISFKESISVFPLTKASCSMPTAARMQKALQSCTRLLNGQENTI